MIFSKKYLLNIHKYCVEDLQCDTHSFQFLKGSPIQHSDLMFELEKIYESSKAYKYKDWETIVDQIHQIKSYNIKNGKTGYLHPAAASIIDDTRKININYLNEIKHDKKKYKACAAPWGTVHINVDGSFFPCLAINMGNVKNGLKGIIYGKKYNEFKDIIKKNGTVEACNRCGWLLPEN